MGREPALPLPSPTLALVAVPAAPPGTTAPCAASALAPLDENLGFPLNLEATQQPVAAGCVMAVVTTMLDAANLNPLLVDEQRS